MIYGSVCSGIEAASVAWHPLGWRAAFLSEIEAFPSAVLAHHYPTAPNLGDMTKFQEWPDAAIDLLVGGTPCQSFSVAGLRKGLADPRGNLMLTYLAIAARYKPRWLVWENVPGVLSSNGGRDFASLLRGLEELGYGFAYRILDAQYFGVPQRRRRVFVVGCLGDWRRAAAVLFERHSLSGHPAPRREAGQRTAARIATSTYECGGTGRYSSSSSSSPLMRTGADLGPGCEALVACPVADSLTVGANQTTGFCGDVVAHSLRAEGFDASEDGTGRGTPLVPTTVGAICADSHPGAYTGQDAYTGRIIPHITGPITAGIHKGPRVTEAVEGNWLIPSGQPVAFHGSQDPDISGDITHPVGRNQGRETCVAQPIGWSEELNALEGVQPTLQRGGAGGRHEGVMTPHMQVRRLTPRECERLQGFPDDYTLITVRNKPAADGPRYKALGNSMAVPVMAWIGERITLVDAIESAERKAA